MEFEEGMKIHLSFFLERHISLTDCEKPCILNQPLAQVSTL